jgi:uncharacterized protein with LGFP repeats
MGWDKDGHAKFSNSNPVRTAGGKGWVQYYSFGDKKEAIYYSDKGAFAVLALEMEAYDAAGQDKFATIVSDPKPTLAGACQYNDIITNDGKEGIIYCKNIVRGEIYKKYKEVNRWEGPMGLPSSTELNTPTTSTDGSKFNKFYKGASRGVIWLTPKNGAVAIWGQMLKMYAKIDYERSWLGWPTESCNPNKGDEGQSVLYQKGRISIESSGCGNYYNTGGLIKYIDGTNPGNSIPPCYYGN